MYYITKEFSFDAAHRLGKGIEYNKEIYGKCCNLHGHRWTLFITIGSHALENGMVINFNELKKIVNEKIMEDLDHHFLNEVEWLKDIEPTCENLSEIIFKRLDKEFIGHLFLEEVKIYETPTSYCVYKE